jgi:DNA-binding NarL/FixJ family response regulator
MTKKIYVQIGENKTEADESMIEYLEEWQSSLKTQEEAQAKERATRESALAKLAALGLTEEEIASL